MFRRNISYKKKYIERLFLVTQYFPPDAAPTGQLLKQLISKLNYKNIKVQTGFPNYIRNNIKVKRFEKITNATVFRSSLSMIIPKKMFGRLINSLFFSIGIFVKFVFLINKNDLIIYTSEPPFLTSLLWIVNKFKNSPYIIIIYDIYPDIVEGLGILKKDNIFLSIWRYLNKLSLKNAQEVIVLNHEMKSKLINKYDIDEYKLHIIPTWVDDKEIKKISKNKNIFLKKNNLEKKFIILYSGNQGRGHDFVTILDAAKELINEPDILFLFIGNGNQNKYLRYQVKKFSLENCKFFPYQEKSELSYSLSSADIALVTVKKEFGGLIAPSKIYSHFAISTPVAVISPPDSYLRKIVEENYSGKWFINNDGEKLAQWIKESKKDKLKLSKMGKNGKNYFLNNATLDICTSKYKLLLNRYNIRHKKD